MASERVSSLGKATHDELCCTYAALILYDDRLDITANQIKKLIEASGNKVDAYWPSLFAKALQGRNVGDLLLGGGGAPAQQTAQPEAHGKKADKAEEKKPEGLILNLITRWEHFGIHF